MTKNNDLQIHDVNGDGKLGAEDLQNPQNATAIEAILEKAADFYGFEGNDREKFLAAPLNSMQLVEFLTYTNAQNEGMTLAEYKSAIAEDTRANETDKKIFTDIIDAVQSLRATFPKGYDNGDNSTIDPPIDTPKDGITAVSLPKSK